MDRSKCSKKNATGYNLTQLIIGSEGTLGIVTKIVFRLIPLPKKDITLLVPFNCSEKEKYDMFLCIMSNYHQL